MVLDEWWQWRRRQRAALRASNHSLMAFLDLDRTLPPLEATQLQPAEVAPLQRAAGDAGGTRRAGSAGGAGGAGGARGSATARQPGASGPEGHELLAAMMPNDTTVHDPTTARAASNGNRSTTDGSPSAEGSSTVSEDTGDQGDKKIGKNTSLSRKDREAAGSRDFGSAGKPMNRQSPFYIGFVGALGVLVAYALWSALGQMGEVFTLLLVALFLTLALDPIVQFLSRRGLRRGIAVAIVFLGLIAVATIVGLIVVPPVATQGAALATNAPNYFTDLLSQRWVQDLDKHYQIITKLQSEVQSKLTDGTFVSTVFGGVLGASRALVSGFFSFFTVLILTLYFLGALPSVKRAAYAVVPESRRERVASLSEEVMRRVGSYAIGQVAIASVNAVVSFVMMSIVGIPYAAVLAVAVGFLGLVPMVGAGLGAVVVCSVAVFDEPHKAVIALVYYVVYQQLENYVIVPRIMQRTVSVPGAVTVIAALAGGTLLGMLGALLAIPVAAGLLLIYEEVLIPRQKHY